MVGAPQKYISEQDMAPFMAQAEEEAKRLPNGYTSGDVNKIAMRMAYDSSPKDIIELKPVENAFNSERAREYMKRDPDYKEKITDSVMKFLNSGNWGKVNDLKHYDIVDLKDRNSLTNTINDLFPGDFEKGKALFNDAADQSPDASRFMSRSQFRSFVDPNFGKEGFAAGGSVSYDPTQVDRIMNSIGTPRLAEGGSVDAPDIEFRDDPESMRLYRHAMKQTTPNPEESVSNFGTGVRARVAGGDLSAGLDMNRMTQGERDQLMNALAANYNVNLGDLNLNARVQKPLDAKDIYAGMLNGSIPLGTGRAMLGVQGMKTPYGSGVTGYNAGWSGQVGPGNLSANVNIPKRGGRSAQVQYQIPFSEGGSARAPANLHPDVAEALKAGRITPNQAKWMSNLANTPGNPEIGTAGIRDGISEKMMNYRNAVRAGEYTRPHFMEPIPKEVKMPKWFNGVVDLDREGLRQLDKIPGLTKQAFKASEYSNTYPVGASDLNYYRELLQELEKDPTYQPYLDEIEKVKQRNPKFAEGGSVSAYNPSRVDAIVNQFM
jgi:hypothetical protein